MERKELMELLFAAAKNQPCAKFSVDDVQEAARNAVVDYLGLTEITGRELRKHRDECFDIIEEVVDQVVPAKMTDILGAFAEVKSFGRDDQVKFDIKRVGKNRIKAAIVPGARGGIYRARRLDTNNLYLTTHVETIAYMITLEELLTGQRNIADVVAVIVEGLVEKVWIGIVQALRAAYASVPALNKATVSGTSLSASALDSVIRTISAYGKPIILGFSSLVDQINNQVNFANAAPNINAQDLLEVRNQGYVGIYHGAPVVKLPNYFVDETNTQWIFQEQDLFILPGDAKPVKVAFQGDAYTAEVEQPHGGKEWHLHKMMGIGLLFYNNIGIYRQDGINKGLY